MRAAVVGAGITGITTAYNLAKAGYDVTIYDQRRYPAMATSYANGGQLSASNAEVWNSWRSLAKAVKWLTTADAPLKVNPFPNIEKYSWLFKFVKAAVEGGAIDVYNKGDMVRDFTYIDDIVLGIIRVIDKPATGDREWKGDASSSSAPYKVYNIGNNNPVRLMDFIEEIEKKLSTKIKKNMMEMQPGDVPQTSACVKDLVNDMDYKPSTSINQGIGKFVDWYLDFYDEEKQ